MGQVHFPNLAATEDDKEYHYHANKRGDNGTMKEGKGATRMGELDLMARRFHNICGLRQFLIGKNSA